jgi:hypothetical protein
MPDLLRATYTNLDSDPPVAGAINLADTSLRIEAVNDITLAVEPVPERRIEDFEGQQAENDSSGWRPPHDAAPGNHAGAMLPRPSAEALCLACALSGQIWPDTPVGG